MEYSCSGLLMYRVLYVDDETGILELVRMYLESYGTLLVDICPSAEEARDLIKETTYDTIVLDYYMPDVNGIQFLKDIREKGMDCPIIIYTGRGREDVVIDALNHGADFYLQKTGEPTREFADLYSKIHQAIRKYHAEKRVKETSALLRSTLESTADGILVVDTEGKVTAWNRKFVQMWNIPYNLIEVGDYSSILSYLLPQVRDPDPFLNRVHEHLRENIRPGIDIIFLRDGRTYERYTQPQMIDGILVGKVWSFRDITAKNNAEEALRESEERFRLLFEQAPVPYQSLDPRGIIIEVNEAWTRMMGYTWTEVTGRQFMTLLSPGDDVDYRQFLAGFSRSDTLIGSEYNLIHKSGRQIPVVITGRVVFDNAGKEVTSLWTFIDISKQRFIESQKNEALAQIQKNLAEFAILNDGIRNPLTVIAGIAELKLAGEKEEILFQIREIDRMIDTLDQRWNESSKILQFLRRHHEVLINNGLSGMDVRHGSDEYPQA